MPIYLQQYKLLAQHCATAQQNYCHDTGVRRPSIVHLSEKKKKTFSQNPLSRLMPNLAERYLFIIYLLSIFFVFQNFAFLIVYAFFSSAWLCQQSLWNRNSSVIHLWHRLSWSYCMDFFQILDVASPDPYAQIFFLIFEIFFLTFYEYVSFS